MKKVPFFNYPVPWERKNVRSILLFVVCLTFCSLPLCTVIWCQTHWTAVTTPLTKNANHITPYFLNETTGFIFLERSSALYKTTDGGSTWITLGPMQGGVNQIYFVSLTRG